MTILFPLVPNWGSGLKETFDFKTDIQTSRNGKEVRRALRQNPRRAVSFSAIADGARLRAYDATLFGALGEVVTLPDYTRKVTLTAALPVTGTTVLISSVPSWLVEGATVALVARRNVALVEIDTISGLTVTLSAPVDQPWPVGAKLRPVLEGYLADGNQMNIITDSVTTVPVDFDLVPGDYVMSGDAPGPLLNGREVLSVRPNRAVSPTATYSRPVDRVDYGFGRAVNFLPVAFATRAGQLSFTRKTAADALILRDFFVRQRGQQGEFYMPSWTDDMTLVNATAGNTYITVAGREIYDAFKDSTVHRAVWMRMNDDTTAQFVITGITLSGSDSRLAVAALSSTISPADVKMMCWLYVSRFNSDNLTINWVTDEVAQIPLSVVSLESLPLASVGTPSWVPVTSTRQTPIVFLDFKYDRYWHNETEVGVDSILYQNDDWGSFDSSAIIPGSGLQVNVSGEVDNAYPAISGAIVSALISKGFSAILTVKLPAAASVNTFAFDFEAATLPGYATDYYAYILALARSDGNYDQSISVVVDNDVGSNSDDLVVVSEPGRQKYAITITPQRVAGSLNGMETISAESDPNPTLDWNSIFFSGTFSGVTGSPPAWIESLAIYATQSDFDLSELSRL